MKITELYVYPIKSLRPASVTRAVLLPEGLKYDRRYMLVKTLEDGQGYKNIQTAYMPECTLFSQEILFGPGSGDDLILVRYHIATPPLVPIMPEQNTELAVPLEPSSDMKGEPVEVSLMGSKVTAHALRDDKYDRWFSACLGYPARLVHVGDQYRPVLAHSPSVQDQKTDQEPASSSFSWLFSISSFIGGSAATQSKGLGGDEHAGERLVFNECAPFLVTSRASLRDVSARLPKSEGDMEMIKFRPNIVVDQDEAGPLEAWEEDFWVELQIGGQHRLALTANCGRCISINIDYNAGRPSAGEKGTVLKKLMKDRRVDPGNKWSPIFGRYAFLMRPFNHAATPQVRTPQIDSRHDPQDGVAGGAVGCERGRDDHGAANDNLESVQIAVGDDVTVTKRATDRDIWSWPKY